MHHCLAEVLWTVARPRIPIRLCLCVCVSILCGIELCIYWSDFHATLATVHHYGLVVHHKIWKHSVAPFMFFGGWELQNFPIKMNGQRSSNCFLRRHSYPRHLTCIQEWADQEDKKETEFFCISVYNEYCYSQTGLLQVRGPHKSSPIRYWLTQKVHVLPDTADSKSVLCSFIFMFPTKLSRSIWVSTIPSLGCSKWYLSFSWCWYWKPYQATRMKIKRSSLKKDKNKNKIETETVCFHFLISLSI